MNHGFGDLSWVFFVMALFPQPTRLWPAVEYVPMPYRGARQGR